MPPLLAAAQLKPDVMVKDVEEGEEAEEAEGEDEDVSKVMMRMLDMVGCFLMRFGVCFVCLILRLIEACLWGEGGLLWPSIAVPTISCFSLSRCPIELMFVLPVQLETFIVGGKRVSLHTSVLEEKATGALLLPPGLVVLLFLFAATCRCFRPLCRFFAPFHKHISHCLPATVLLQPAT
jgi:hypothetical protein